MTHRSSSQYAPGTNGTTAVVPVPAGAAVGDIAVVGIYKESTAAVSAPDGTWTAKAALTTSATARGALHVFWKRLTAADTGTWTFTWTGSTFRAAAAGLWSGRVASGDPFDGTPGTAESTAGVTTLNVSTSPTNANGDAVGFWTNFNGGSGFTAPTNYTQRQVASNVIALETRDAVAAGSTGNVTATCTVTDFMKAFLGVLAPAATGTALNLSATTETDAAPALSATKTQAYAATAETDAAQGWNATKAPTLPVTAEADTAPPWSASKAQTYGAATETDAARGWAATKAQTYGIPAETDAAPVLAVSKAPVYGVPAETGTAWAMTFSKGITLGRATEADAAQQASFTVGGGTALPLSTAAETDTARGIALAKTGALLAAPESDAAPAVSLSKAPALARATETGTALVMAFSKGAVLGRATEVGTARGSSNAKAVALGRASELDAALPAVVGAVTAYDAPEHWTVRTVAPAILVAERPAAIVGDRAHAYTATTRVSRYAATTRENP